MPGLAFLNPRWGAARRRRDVGEVALPAQPPKPRKRKWIGSMCHIFSPGSALQMLVGLVLGVAIGWGVKAAYNFDTTKTAYAVTWVSFPGECFLRLVKCFDLPLISLNIAVGVQGIVKLQNAGTVGLRTVVLYFFTSMCASIQAVITFALFKPAFYQLQPDQEGVISRVALSCGDGYYFGVDPITGAVSCNTTSATTFSATFSGDGVITVPGVPHSAGEIIKNLGYAFAADNLVSAFSEPNVLAVLCLSLVFGLAMATVRPQHGESNVLVEGITQLRETLLIIMEYLIALAPYALVSLTAGAIASANVAAHVAANVLLLLAAAAVAYGVHTLLVVPGLLAAVTWRNPWSYLARYRYAYRKAFRTGSADEALDKTVEAAVEAGEVSATVAGFVLPLGIDLNLDGAGVFYPLAVLFLAHVGGMDADVTPGTLVIIAIVSVMTSIGAHTMPNGGLIMLMAIWQACFNGIYYPPLEIAYVLALQWFFDRCIAATNVVTDTAVAKIIDATTHGAEDLRSPRPRKRVGGGGASGGDGGDDDVETGAAPGAAVRGDVNSKKTLVRRTSLWDAHKAPPRSSLRVLVNVNEVLERRRTAIAAGVSTSALPRGSSARGATLTPRASSPSRASGSYSPAAAVDAGGGIELSASAAATAAAALRSRSPARRADDSLLGRGAPLAPGGAAVSLTAGSDAGSAPASAASSAAGGGGGGGHVHADPVPALTPEGSTSDASVRNSDLPSVPSAVAEGVDDGARAAAAAAVAQLQPPARSRGADPSAPRSTGATGGGGGGSDVNALRGDADSPVETITRFFAEEAQDDDGGGSGRVPHSYEDRVMTAYAVARQAAASVELKHAAAAAPAAAGGLHLAPQAPPVDAQSRVRGGSVSLGPATVVANPLAAAAAAAPAPPPPPPRAAYGVPTYLPPRHGAAAATPGAAAGSAAATAAALNPLRTAGAVPPRPGAGAPTRR